MKKAIFWGAALICVLVFDACTKVEDNIPSLSLSETSDYKEEEDIASENTESQEAASAQKHWVVNICSDMPECYIDVLRQYEQFMNADNQDLNDESVQAKLWGGEWNDLYDELCGAWAYSSKKNEADAVHYALTDITGDGFPELIMARGDTPYVVYHYSEKNGIGKECWSSYFTMTIYKNGIMEYVSGGAYSSTTYLQFQEDAQEWVVLDIIASESTWDSANQEWIDEKYYTGEWDDGGRLTDTISEEEYLQIQEKYVTEPMTFEWIPLAYLVGR